MPEIELIDQTVAVFDAAADPMEPAARPPAEEAFSIGIDHDDLVAQVLSKRDNYEAISQELRDVTWKDCWECYKNEQDYSAKEDWMAKVRVPKVRSKVKKFVSLIRHILMRDDKYIRFEPRQTDAQTQEESGFGNDEAHAQLATKAVKLDFDRVDFKGRVLDVVEGAGVIGVWFAKLGWEPVQTEKVKSVLEPVLDEFGQPLMEQVVDPDTGMPSLSPVMEWQIKPVVENISGLSFDAVDPRDLFYDPDHSQFIERTTTTLGRLLAENAKDPAIYNQAQLDRLREEDYTSPQQDERYERLGLSNEKDAYDKTVYLLEAWIDVVDKDTGEIVIPNARIVVANEKYVLNWPTPDKPDWLENPYYHGRKPYIALSPIKLLGRKDGVGIVEPLLTMQEAYNNLINMEFDRAVINIVGFPQVHVGWLDNPEDAESRVPGRPIWINGQAQGKPAYVDTPVRDNPVSARYLGDLLDNEMQQASMVPDVLMGFSPQRRDPTATETKSNISEAHNYFDAVSRNIERFIEECAEMARQLRVQYGFGPDERPDMVRAFERDIEGFAAMTAAERVRFLQSDMDVKATGISSYFRMQDALRRVIDLIDISSKFPPLGRRLDLWKVAQKVFANAGLEAADELIIPEKEEKMLRMAERVTLVRQLQQAMAPPQMQPGGPQEGQGPQEPPEQEKAALREQVRQMTEGLSPEQREKVKQEVARRMSGGVQ